MKLINLTKTAIVGASLAFFVSSLSAQVVGGEPKAGGSSAGTSTSPSPAAGTSPVIESAADTNRQKNGATLGQNGQNAGAMTDTDKASKENKAEDGEKSKVKKHKKHQKEGKTDEEKPATESSPKASSASSPSS